MNTVSALQIAGPTGTAPSNNGKAKCKADPKQGAFRRITPPIDHAGKQKQGNQLPGGIVDHGWRRILRTNSYTAQKINPMMTPSNILSSIPSASIGALTMRFKVFAFGAWLVANRWLNGQCFFNCPSGAQSLINHMRRKIKLSLPLRLRQCFTVKCKENVVAFVAGLFKFRSPATIFWAIWAVIIFSFNRIISGRSITHIGKEIFKGSPSVTDDNTPAAISWITADVRIDTSLNHQIPNVIEGTAALRSIAMSETGFSFARKLAHQTATRFGIAFFQSLVSNPFFSTTGATTIPRGATALYPNRLIWKNRPSFKLFSGKIKFYWHTVNINTSTVAFQGGYCGC